MPHPFDERYEQIGSADECIEQSQARTVVVFKHSSTCPVSTYAKREVDSWLKNSGERVYLVVVQQERLLSGALAERLSVRHESPQVLCLSQGQVKAVFNHHEITEAALKSTFAV